MQILSSKLLIPVAVVIAVILFWFRPGGIEGPRCELVPMSGKVFDHSGLTKVLSAVVSPDGTVDYGKLRAEPGPLNHYLGQLAAKGPKNAPQLFRTNDDRLAYYLNAYNAFVLAAVRDHCPLDSVQTPYFEGGFFWRLSFVMGREELTLNDLEAERIRGVSQQAPEVHLALVKGARGSPALGTVAFDPSTLKAQLHTLGEKTAKDPRYVSREGNTLHLSTLFEWYKTDFGDVNTWIGQHAPDLVKGATTAEIKPFDWGLNGSCGATAGGG